MEADLLSRLTVLESTNSLGIHFISSMNCSFLGFRIPVAVLRYLPLIILVGAGLEAQARVLPRPTKVRVVKNQPPTVSAGADQTVTLPAAANLNGTATDDGFPKSGTLTQTWSKVSGPGAVTFGNVNALATTANFAVAGTYVLRLTASDSALLSSDDVTVTVKPTSAATGPTIPALPQARVDTTYVQPTGRTISVGVGGNFQAALNDALPGDVITL